VLNLFAVVVSDSAIVRSAIEHATAQLFQNVVKLKQVSELAGVKVWDDALLVVELNHPQSEISALVRMVPEDALARAIVLTKQNGDLRSLTPLLGKVGAIMPASSEAEEIALVARIAKKGLVLLPSEMMPLLRDVSADRLASTAASARLTERETSVLALIAEGRSNKIIARSLGINDTTVRVHVRSVLKKMNLHNRTEAALLVALSRARQLGEDRA